MRERTKLFAQGMKLIPKQPGTTALEDVLAKRTQEEILKDMKERADKYYTTA
jgi:hypothetical protein